MDVFPDIVILAGGFGTRLKSVIKDVPKPMAPVAGKPFLEWLINYLSAFKPNKIILSTGYRHDIIEEYFGNQFKTIPIVYSIETEPLGTGGAIKKALNCVETSNCMVLNGDTLFKINHREFLNSHLSSNSIFSMALKPMVKPYRYGTVSVEQGIITRFNEKNPDLDEGLINTGVYLMSAELIAYLPEQEKFSIETDFMEKKTGEIAIRSFVSDDYFIDIGIPEDYKKAEDDFPLLFN